MRRKDGNKLITSPVSPLLEKANTTSSEVTIPKSPCTPSPGCKNNAGVPVLANVAEIFRAICPDFPIPVQTTRPLEAKINSTAASNRWSNVSIKSNTAFDSSWSTCAARSSIFIVHLHPLHLYYFFTILSIATKSVNNSSRESKYNIFGPSESASSGLS